jgi:subfamily B ATP-binding cassette protein MsbA
MAYDIRLKMHNTLMRRHISFFQELKTGDFVVRFINNVNSIRDVICNTIVELVSNAIQFIAVVTVMSFISWKLCIVVMVIIPIALLVNRAFGKRIQMASKQDNEETGRISSIVSENIEGIKQIKIFNLYQHKQKTIEESAKKIHKNKLKLNLFYYLQSNIINTGPLLLATCVLVVGAILVANQEISVGTLLMISSIAHMAYRPVVFFSNVGISIKSSMSSIERVLEFTNNVDNEQEIIPLEFENNTIVFDKVSFSYIDKEILHDISIKINPKEKIFILGETGSGKSTIVNLINGLYTVNDGAVYLNGEPIREIGSYSGIVTVSQDPFLFATSIYENIRLGNLDAQESEIYKVARVALVDDFVTGMTDGYNSFVGERGVSLSGGERQRISIARALVANPKILILDEATSAIDIQTQKQINENIHEYLPNSIIIQITHRIETIRNADHIIMLKSGRIIEQGSYRELMDKQESLYDLYNTLLMDNHSGE